MTDLSVYAKDTSGQEHKLLVYGFRGNDESEPWARLAVEIEAKFYEASLYKDGRVCVDRSGVWPYIHRNHRGALIALYRGAFCRPITVEELAELNQQDFDAFVAVNHMDFVL